VPLVLYSGYEWEFDKGFNLDAVLGYYNLKEIKKGFMISHKPLILFW
jgi:hypothetical protein